MRIEVCGVRIDAMAVVLTWNVAGRVRSVAEQAAALREQAVDVIALQEVRASALDAWRAALTGRATGTSSRRLIGSLPPSCRARRSAGSACCSPPVHRCWSATRQRFRGPNAISPPPRRLAGGALRRVRSTSRRDGYPRAMPSDQMHPTSDDDSEAAQEVPDDDGLRAHHFADPVVEPVHTVTPHPDADHQVPQDQ
jgi:hypothetical protein